MPRPKRKLEGEIEVGGDPFIWRLDREQQWCTADKWQGLRLAVRHRDGQREAHIQFPVAGPQRSYHLVRPAVTPEMVANGIAAAISVGWEPLSRGKPFNVEVDAEGR